MFCNNKSMPICCGQTHSRRRLEDASYFCQQIIMSERVARIFCGAPVSKSGHQVYELVQNFGSTKYCNDKSMPICCGQTHSRCQVEDASYFCLQIKQNARVLVIFCAHPESKSSHQVYELVQNFGSTKYCNNKNKPT